MLRNITRYFSLIICSIYTYRMILNVRPKSRKSYYIICSVFSAALATLSYLLLKDIDYFEFVFMIVMVTLFLTRYYSKDFSLSFNTVLISFSYSYIVFSIVSVPLVTFNYIVLGSFLNPTLLQFIGMFIQFAVCTIPFRFNRFKNGLSFINKPFYSTPFTVIGILVILAAMLLNAKTKGTLIHIVPLSFLLICAIFMLSWWQSYTTREYMDRIRSREFQEYVIQLQDKDIKINQLENEVKHLSSLIHKDNKLLPAMELAVENMINNPDSHDKEKLLDRLKDISSERTGILNRLETSEKYISTTGNIAIDSLFGYMHQRACRDEINFNVIADRNITEWISNPVTEDELSTILADITENAIIATESSDIKNVMVNFDTSSCLTINVYDSGPAFDINVLANWGRKRYTTHENEGGSGIGLYTTYEILKKHNGSFLIEEFDIENKSFTKKVSIIFDYSDEYMLKSTRSKSDRHTLKSSLFKLI